MLRKSHPVLAFLFLILCRDVFPQDIGQAIEIIQTLSSPAYHGRGYVNDGVNKSAAYLEGEFRKAGLYPLSEDYFQEFSMPVNTFPGKMEVQLNTSILNPAIDFIVDPSSGGLKGTYPVKAIDCSALADQKTRNRFLKKAQGAFLLIDYRNRSRLDEQTGKQIGSVIDILKYDPGLKIAGTIVLSDEKLSWSVSPFRGPRPVILTNIPLDIDTVKSITLNIESKWLGNYPVRNIIGYLPGTVGRDSFIAVTAHYDHLGQMGNDVYFPGANDNASGVAVMLTIAAYFAAHPAHYSILFIAFAGEEAGLLGSRYYVENPYFELCHIKFLINLDLAGTGDEGITVVNGSVFKEKFELLTEINSQKHLLPQVKSRGEACNSDHCYFYKAGVPCFFIYTMGGGTAYHDIYDTYDALTG